MIILNHDESLNIIIAMEPHDEDCKCRRCMLATHEEDGYTTDNVPTLGEGGDFYHKYQCGERMLNMAVNVKRSTAPPLLPNVC